MGGMRWRPLLLLFLLSACARPDTLPPEVGLVYPQGGGVAPGRSLLAEGYAFDPSGVVSVRVNGREVLEAPSRGKPLVAFRFRLEAPSSGTAEIVLEAEDGVGNRATRRVAFTLDNDPPRIQLERTERLEGGGAGGAFGEGALPAPFLAQGHLGPLRRGGLAGERPHRRGRRGKPR